MRKQRDVDAYGNRVVLAYVLEKMKGWGVANPTEDNIKSHLKNHCAVTTGATGKEIVVQQHDGGITVLKDIAEGKARHEDVDETLKSIVTLGMEGIKKKIESGANPISVDHILKASSELTRRSHNETQRQLLDELAGGLQAAFGAIAPPRALPDAEVVEAEDAEFDVVVSDDEEGS